MFIRLLKRGLLKFLVHLSHFEPPFLTIQTTHFMCQKLHSNEDNMEVDEPSMAWKKVIGKVRSPTRRQVTYSQPDNNRIKPPRMSKSSHRKSSLTSLSSAAAPKKSPGILRSTGTSMFRNKDPATSSIPLSNTPPPVHPPPAQKPAPVVPITPSPNKETPGDASVNTSHTAQMSQATNGTTLHQVKTYDGTTRITIR